MDGALSRVPRFGWVIVLIGLQTATAAGVIAEPGSSGTTSGLMARGQLVAQRFTTLSSEISAKIEQLTVRDGDRFEAGQLLIQLECAVHHAQLKEAQAALAVASRTRQINQRLRQLDSATELEREISIADEVRAEARVEAIAAIISKCTMSAPFRGRVSDLRVQPLQFVQAGQALLEIVDDQGFEVAFLAPSQWLKWLEIGRTFAFEIEENGKTYEGAVIRIGAQVDPVSQTIKVYGRIITPSDDMVAGMSGQLRF